MRIVPEKPPNNDRQLSAEAVEGRRPAKGNLLHSTTPRTQRRKSVSCGVQGVRGSLPYCIT